jgi:2-methylisocitrate lyase-like PEP mutase family enzyme
MNNSSPGIDRAAAYVEAGGGDMIFAEALYSLEDYRAFAKAVLDPVLANITLLRRQVGSIIYEKSETLNL